VAMRNNGALSVRYNDGLGTFVQQLLLPMIGYANRPAIGDLNGDGHLDLALPLEYSLLVTFFFGDGLGGFVPGTPLQYPFGPTGAALEDFDADGDIDVVVTTTDGRVWVHRNQGGGVLAPPLEGPVIGYAPVALTSADVDDDGDLDLVTANLGSGTISVLANDGSAGFEGVREFAAVDRAYRMALGDLDGDGDLDVCVTSDQRLVLATLINDCRR